MNAKTFVKRTLGVTALALGGLALVGPSAEAGTATGNFTVRTQVFGTCTVTTPDLTFPNYTTGQTTAVNGQTQFTIACPGASATSPLTANWTFAPSGGTFRMTGAPTPDPLNYTLCDGAACGTAGSTAYAAGAAGPNITIAAISQPYDLFGQIPAAQVATAGTYTQAVTATLTF